MDYRVQIESWIQARKGLLKKCQRQDGDDSSVIEEVDRYGDRIFKALMDNFEQLSCDFILESLTCLGYAPSVLYDDSSCWAISGDGMQPVVCGNDRISGNMTFFMVKKQWFKTIRSALKFYMREIKR